MSKLPWKVEHAPLPINFTVATQRIRNMIRRLPSETRKIYNKLITDQETCRFIELVQNDDQTSIQPNVKPYSSFIRTSSFWFSVTRYNLYTTNLHELSGKIHYILIQYTTFLNFYLIEFLVNVEIQG